MSFINEDRTIWELPVTTTVNLSDLVAVVNEGETKQVSLYQLDQAGYQGLDLKSLSANWESTFTIVNDASAGWNFAYTNVRSNSANYILDGGNTKNQNLTIGTNDQFHVNFESNNINRMIILSSGNIGVNTLHPNHPLTVNGNISSTDAFVTSKNNVNNHYVGVNVQNPYPGLFSTAKIKFDTNVTDAGIWLQSQNNPHYAGSGSLNINQSQPFSLGFGTDDHTRMVITSSGNVGINNLNPTEELAVFGDVEINNTADPTLLRLKNETGWKSIWELRAYDTLLGFPWKQFSIYGGLVGGTITDRMTITTDGDVGIGTTIPSAKLDVDGDISVSDKVIHGSDLDTCIRFPLHNTFSIETFGSERFRILPNGDIGINTPTPSEKLEVNGNIKTSGNIQSTGDITGANTPKWDSTHATTQTLSAGWVSTQQTVNSLSAVWQSFMINCTDETSNLVASLTPVYKFSMPYAMKLNEVRAFASEPPVGNPIKIDIRHNGSSIFTTKLEIDNSSNSSVGSSTPAVIASSFTQTGTGLLDNANMAVYIEQTGTTTAGKGLKIIFK